MYILKEIYHGFKLIEETKIRELDTTSRLFEHVKSGARLLHLENKDDNKVFCIYFRTPPEDNTGAAHIIEHTVLCGSKKFKTKDVFADMEKSSLNTFINAITYPDRTSFPISSRNHKDFFNLMEVYLDSVFYPNIYKNHELLRQEGWRYEIDEETGKLVYNGIVYSEMQGALSSPEQIVAQNIYSSLFPNTIYAYNSAGDPDYIPELTQDKFEKFHKKYYHPSNSYIYMYGDQNLDECLKLINDEYLMNFDKIEVPSHIDVPDNFSQMAEQADEYSISEDESEEGKTFLTLNFACEYKTNPEAYLAMKIMNNLLIESSASPIKKALLNAGIGEGVLTNRELGINFTKKSIFSIAVNNTDEDKKEEFKRIIYDTFKSLVENGIDKKLLEASINSVEFELREADPWRIANKGLTCNSKIMDSWLYDGNPIVHLCYEDTLSKLKKAMHSNYFEAFIQKYFINNNHRSLVAVKPKRGLAEAKAKILEDKLQKYKESLTDVQIKELKERNALLKASQMRENTKEELATIPKLSLNEIAKKAEKLPQRVINEKGFTILSHNINTNKVAYIDLLFDARVIEEKYIPYLGLLRDIIGEIDTMDRSYSELNTEIYRKTGGISFNTNVYSDKNNKNICYPKFVIKSKVLFENVDVLFQLMNEIITSTKFDSIKRIKEVIREKKGNLKRYIIAAGSRIAFPKAISYFSKEYRYRDMLSGASYYQFICDIEKNFENKFEEIKTSLQKVYEAIFNTNNLIISYTGDEEYENSIASKTNILLANLNTKMLKANDIDFKPYNQAEAIIINTNVQYVVKAFDYTKLDNKYSGKMRVLENILSSEYLYTRVRLQGGAYGCYMYLVDNNTIAFESYRDPNLIETMKIYDEAYKFLNDINYSKENLEGFIVGAIGKLDQPLTPDRKGEDAVKNYICGITYADIQRERDELLSTSLDDIKSYSTLIKKGMDENYCCVVGNESRIKDNKDSFDKIITLS